VGKGGLGGTRTEPGIRPEERGRGPGFNTLPTAGGHGPAVSPRQNLTRHFRDSRRDGKLLSKPIACVPPAPAAGFFLTMF